LIIFISEISPNSSEHQLRCLSCTPDHDKCVYCTNFLPYGTCVLCGCYVKTFWMLRGHRNWRRRRKASRGIKAVKQ